MNSELTRIIQIGLGLAGAVCVVQLFVVIVRGSAKRQLPPRFLGGAWLAGIGMAGGVLTRLLSHGPARPWIQTGFTIVGIAGMVLIIKALKRIQQEKQDN